MSGNQNNDLLLYRAYLRESYGLILRSGVSLSFLKFFYLGYKLGSSQEGGATLRTYMIDTEESRCVLDFVDIGYFRAFFAIPLN